jgi:hypothetical protein
MYNKQWAIGDISGAGGWAGVVILLSALRQHYYSTLAASQGYLMVNLVNSQ